MLHTRSEIAPTEVQQRTKAYVESQALVNLNPSASSLGPVPLPHIKESAPTRPNFVSNPTPAHDARSVHPDTQKFESPPALEQHTYTPHCSLFYSYQPSKAYQRQQHPTQTSESPRTPTKEWQISAATPNPAMMDFVKYMARRWLVTTGLNRFDDWPDSFRSWRSSFLNATSGLELDLLIKWLGKEFSEHLKNAMPTQRS